MEKLPPCFVFGPFSSRYLQNSFSRRLAVANLHLRIEQGSCQPIPRGRTGSGIKEGRFVKCEFGNSVSMREVAQVEATAAQRRKIAALFGWELSFVAGASAVIRKRQARASSQ